MQKKLLFRSWFYFRTGWSTYFAFILGAVNTLTVTYYLAIDKAPDLKALFPSFTYYAVVITLIAVPILTLIGYIHFKKSSSFKAEADIYFESNPHFRRLIQNSEFMIPVYAEILELLTKFSQNEKLSDDELQRILKIKKQLDDYKSTNPFK